MEHRDEAVALLKAMGFEHSAARAALEWCSGNVEASANFLLNGHPSFAASGTSGSFEAVSSAEVRNIHCPLSQYSLEAGQSSCTCIAMTNALHFLRSSNHISDLSPEFLQCALLAGNQTYLKIARNRTVEHMSAEEALDSGEFQCLELIGSVRQGIISRDDQHPLGFAVQLQECKSERFWTCVLITKTPESVVICLPPSSETEYVLIDSHPRCHLFGTEGSYARIHFSLSALVDSLKQIFPMTDLGSDVPELMAAMYNSFDLYAFQYKQILA
jgi:hypothetical protein